MIELVFFLHYIVNSMLEYEYINTPLFLMKGCYLNSTTDSSRYGTCDHQGVNQALISAVKDYSYLLTLCTSTLFITLATSWSDLSGKRRRPLIILSISSQILQLINVLAHYFIWSWNPIVAIIINMLFESIGGMNMMFFMALIYICDKSAAENRTMRVGLLWAIRSLCSLLSEQIVTAFSSSVRSFLTLYPACLSLSIISLLLALCLVKDISVDSDTEQSFVFSITKIFQSFKDVFEKSLGKKRRLVLILMAVYIAVYFTIEGENSVFNEFLTYRTDSTTSQYYLYFLRYFADIFGTLFCSFILSKRFRIRDVSIGIFAGVCNIIGVISYLITADVEWGLYAATMSHGFSGAVLSVTVSSLSKFYESGKFGRLIAVLNLFWLAILPSRWMYYKVLAKISISYPPVFFLISLILNGAALYLYCISLKFWRLESAPL